MWNSQTWNHQAHCNHRCWNMYWSPKQNKCRKPNPMGKLKSSFTTLTIWMWRTSVVSKITNRIERSAWCDNSLKQIICIRSMMKPTTRFPNSIMLHCARRHVKTNILVNSANICIRQNFTIFLGVYTVQSKNKIKTFCLQAVYSFSKKISLKLPPKIQTQSSPINPILLNKPKKKNHKIILCCIILVGSWMEITQAFFPSEAIFSVYLLLKFFFLQKQYCLQTVIVWANVWQRILFASTWMSTCRIWWIVFFYHPYNTGSKSFPSILLHIQLKWQR